LNFSNRSWFARSFRKGFLAGTFQLRLAGVGDDPLLILVVGGGQVLGELVLVAEHPFAVGALDASIESLFSP